MAAQPRVGVQELPLLQTKLYTPPVRPGLVSRPRLLERLDAGLDRKLTLVSAPAGFGKTTLVSEWIASHRRGGPRLERRGGVIPPAGATTAPLQFAWLSLDEGDNDLTRFLTYLVAALQAARQAGAQQAAAAHTNIGQGMLAALQSPQPPPAEVILTALINDIAAHSSSAHSASARIVLVLDDYHLIEAQPVHEALAFLLRHLPLGGPAAGGLHLVIATREDPLLPLARLRARGQLTELRATDLRFTASEAAEFLNQVMGLGLSAQEIAVLETRTEGWIAGLQLAALAMLGSLARQGTLDTAGFVRSFTGSHRFVLDYLVGEVLEQQPESIQTFLQQTCILDRLTASLCDAVRFGAVDTPSSSDGTATLESSAAILERLERANLFIVPLDGERRWYRYHRLFADLLRQRLRQSAASPSLGGTEGGSVAELHRRASVWYQENGLEIEAFQHAAAANDVERAARLMEGEGMPLHFRGAMVPVLNWLRSLPTTTLDARPSLWVTYASALTMAGRPIASVEEKLLAAEAALAASAAAEPDGKTRDLLGQIAAIRAMLALPQNRIDSMLAESRRALEFLHPDNLPARTGATWTLGYAYQLQGDRAAAGRAYSKAISISQASGNTMIALAAITSLGQIQESENQLYRAAESYRRGQELAGDPLLPGAAETYLGLARIHYQWNDLDAAQEHAQQALQLARQMQTVATPAHCQVLLACLELARGDAAAASTILDEAEQFVRRHNFARHLSEVAAVRVRALLQQGRLAAASDLVEQHPLPAGRARVYLARGDPGSALAALEPLRQQAEAKGWESERLEVMVLQAVALHARARNAHDTVEKAVHLLGDALALAEPGGIVRVFVDEGPPMARLLHTAVTRGIAGQDPVAQYAARLLAAFPTAESEPPVLPQDQASASELVEPLSEREVEVLQLISEGLTNPEIAARLYLALNTVKAHTRNIYGKLGVHNRTQAIARARALGVLAST